MQFDDYQTKAVRNQSPLGVPGARYRDDKRQVIVLANTTGRQQRGIRWQCAVSVAGCRCAAAGAQGVSVRRT